MKTVKSKLYGFRMHFLNKHIHS